MRLPDDPNKFTSQFKYVELARYVPSLNRLTREMTNGEATLVAIQDLPTYIERKGEVGIYSSVFQHDSNDLSNSASLGPVYFDLDADDIAISHSETVRLVRHLLLFIPRSALRLYFSGRKGFHVECEPVALGITPTDELPGVFRTIAADIRDKLGLTTMDFNVYDWRRMWRVPNTKHQHSGLYKVECMSLFDDDFSVQRILKHAGKPRPNVVPEQVFDPRANSWYREYTYKYEQDQLHRKQSYDADMINRFLTEGVGSQTHNYNSERLFDRVKLLQGCEAVRNLVHKARTEHFLTHYERLFLCSLLTYSDEAIVFLHEVLSECDDYRFEISNSHIEDWIKRREYDIGGRPFTCQKASEVGISCSDCGKMEARRKVVKLSSGSYMETSEYSAPSPVRFAYSAKKK